VLQINKQKTKSSFADAKDVTSDADEIKISRNELDSIDNLFSSAKPIKEKKTKSIKKRKKSKVTHYATLGMTKKEYKNLSKKAKEKKVTLSDFILDILYKTGQF